MIAAKRRRQFRRFVPSCGDEGGSKLEGRSLTTLFRRTVDPGILAQVRGIWGAPLVLMTDTSAAPHKTAIALSTGAAPPPPIAASASGTANNQVIDGGLGGGIHLINVNVALQNSCTVTTAGIPTTGVQLIESQADSGVAPTGGALGPAIVETFYDNSNINPTPGPFVITGTFAITYTPPLANSTLFDIPQAANIAVASTATGAPILAVATAGNGDMTVAYSAPNGAGGFAVTTTVYAGFLNPASGGGTKNVIYSANVAGGVSIAYGTRLTSAANPTVVGGSSSSLTWHLDCYVP